MNVKNRPHLWALFLTFLKIGVVAFGGYLGIVSVVERELAEKKKFLKNQTVLDGLALALVLPGPVGANVAAYCGFVLRGLPGALVSIAGLILPAFFLLLAFSEIYARYGEVPAVAAVLAGFLPALVAIVLAVAWKLGKQNVKERFQWAITFVSMVVFWLMGGFATALGLLVGSGIVGILQKRALSAPASIDSSDEDEFHQPVAPAFILAVLVLLGTLCWWQWGGVGILRQLWLSFSSMSLVMFGGGYVFIPMMKEVVVHQQAWVNAKEFADAIALGQITPGPIMIAATFIGYRVAGVLGAVLATLAIFGPSALLMVICSGLHQKVADSPVIKAAYSGIRPCVVGLIINAAIALAGSGPLTLWSVLIFVVALVATIKYKLDTLWVLPSAGLLGLLISQF